MGQLISSLYKLFYSDKEYNVVLLGLDNAGKTSLLYKLHLGELVHTIPTIGFNVERVEYKNLNFTIWDVGGQDKLRPLWKHYYRGAHALIYVIDSNDELRIEESKFELESMLKEHELKDIVVLVFANKQDLPHALDTACLVRKLNLNHICKQKWFIQPCCALNGEGLSEGLVWLSDTLIKHDQK